MFKTALALATVALVASTEASFTATSKNIIAHKEAHDFKVIADCDLPLSEKKESLIRSRVCKNKDDCKVLDRSIKNRKHCQKGKSPVEKAMMDEENDQLQAFCTEGWSCIAIMGFAELDRCISEGNKRKAAAMKNKNKKFDEEEETRFAPSVVAFDEEEALDSLQAWCSSPQSCNMILQYMRNECNALSKY